MTPARAQSLRDLPAREVSRLHLLEALDALAAERTAVENAEAKAYMFEVDLAAERAAREHAERRAAALDENLQHLATADGDKAERLARLEHDLAAERAAHAATRASADEFYRALGVEAEGVIAQRERAERAEAHRDVLMEQGEAIARERDEARDGVALWRQDFAATHAKWQECQAALAAIRAALEHHVHDSPDVTQCSFTYGGPNYVEQDGRDGQCRYALHRRPCEHCQARLADLGPDPGAPLRAVVAAARAEHVNCELDRRAGLKPHPCEVCDMLAELDAETR